MHVLVDCVKKQLNVSVESTIPVPDNHLTNQISNDDEEILNDDDDDAAIGDDESRRASIVHIDTVRMRIEDAIDTLLPELYRTTRKIDDDATIKLTMTADGISGRKRPTVVSCCSISPPRLDKHDLKCSIH